MVTGEGVRVGAEVPLGEVGMLALGVDEGAEAPVAGAVSAGEFCELSL